MENITFDDLLNKEIEAIDEDSFNQDLLDYIFNPSEEELDEQSSLTDWVREMYEIND